MNSRLFLEMEILYLLVIHIPENSFMSRLYDFQNTKKISMHTSLHKKQHRSTSVVDLAQTVVECFEQLVAFLEERLADVVCRSHEDLRRLQCGGSRTQVSHHRRVSRSSRSHRFRGRAA